MTRLVAENKSVGMPEILRFSQEILENHASVDLCLYVPAEDHRVVLYTTRPHVGRRVIGVPQLRGSEKTTSEERFGESTAADRRG